MVSYYTNYYPSLLLAFYSDGNNNGYLTYGFQNNANQATYTGGYVADTGNSPDQFFQVDQNTVLNGTSAGVSAIVFNNNLYVAYVEAGSHQMVVLQAQVITSSANTYFFHEIYRDTNGQVTSTPGAAVQNGNLVFVYGTNRNPNINNEAWTTWLDAQGIWHSEDANTNTPTQPGLASFNGRLYMVAKQNNSNNGIWMNILNDTGHFSSGNQINGGSVYWRTPFGFSMTVWNNELIFAADGQGGGSPLCIYASYDGANWVAQSYPGLYIGSTPAITLFGNGLSAAGQVNGSQYTMLATHN